MDAKIDASTAKQALLRELISEFDGDAAAIGRLVVDEGRVVALGLVAIGSEAFLASRRATQGVAMDGFRIDADHVWAFNVLQHVKPDNYPRVVREQLWTGPRMREAIGMNMSDGDHFVGHIGVFRSTSSPPFTAHDVARAQGMSSTLIRRYTAILADADGSPLQIGTFVFDAGGQFVSGSAALPECGRAVVGLCVRQFLSGDRLPMSLYGDWLLSQLHLRDDSQGSSVVVTIRRVRRGRVPPIMKLTAWKRRIAMYAARGATIPEIALALERQPETIRAHLKQIYETLGVGSRVELADLCRLLWISEEEDPGT